jgi:Family of unknown function (DUF6167)
MRRLFWLAVGAGLTGLAVRRFNRVVHAVSPDGIAGRVSAYTAVAREFGDEVRAGMEERELELRDALGLDRLDEGREHEYTGDERGVH